MSWIPNVYTENNGLQFTSEVEQQDHSIIKSQIQITQAEHRDWKIDIKKYLLLYRNIPQATPGVSPTGLLFGQKLRTKLSALQDYNVGDTEVCDRDSENKQKEKIYSYNTRSTQHGEIS